MARRIREMFSSNHEDRIYRVNSSHHQHQPRLAVDSRLSHHYDASKHHPHVPFPVVELHVPMCCEKCQEKVHEELEDLEGVRAVECNQLQQKVTVFGYVDPVQVLKKVKKVKKRSEFFTQGNKSESHIAQYSPRHRDAGPYAGQLSGQQDTVAYTNQPSLHRDSERYVGHHSVQRDSGRHANQVSGHPDSVRYAGQLAVHGGPRSAPTNSFERGLSRQPSFGQMTHHHGLSHHDFETRDLHRDSYGIRRMPSFKNHRYPDAEFVSMAGEYMPQYGETHYPGSKRSMLQPQISFSNLPVTNPHYVKPVYHED